MMSSKSTYIPRSKVTTTVPPRSTGAYVLLRILVQTNAIKDFGDDFGMMFFMCENYEYDPPKHYGNDRAKVL